MKNNCKKLVSVLIALTFLTALLTPLSLSAEARSVISVDRIPALSEYFTGIAATMTIKEDRNLPNDYRGGDSFRLVLKPGVKWLRNGNDYVDENGNPVQVTISNTGGSEDLIISVMSDTTMEVRLPDVVGGGAITNNNLTDTITIPLAVDINGVTGDIYVNIEAMDSSIYGDTNNTFTTVWGADSQPQITSTNTKGWDAIADEVRKLVPGSNRVINLHGNNLVPSGVIHAIVNKDVTLSFMLNNQVAVDLNGKDVNTSRVGAVDVDVKLDEKGIPEALLKGFEGVKDSRQFALSRDGINNFKHTLRIFIDGNLKGEYATLFCLSQDQLVKVSAAPIDSRGWAVLENDRKATAFVILVAAEELEALEPTESAEPDPKEEEPLDPVPGWYNPFSDVSIDNWYYPGVEYVYTEGLMTGTEISLFSPQVTMSRSMMVTVLWRYAGAPTGGANNFTDVPPGIWYSEAVNWAATLGIVEGMDEETFAPGNPITREQMAAILYRCALYTDLDVDMDNYADLMMFADLPDVAPWAEEPLGWCNANGLIQGRADGDVILLEPKGLATRAEVATILMRMAALS